MDEKRRLYKKLSKAGLQSEETAYMNVINGNKAGDGRPFSPTQKQNRRENTSHRSESVYEQQYHNVDGKVQRVVNALSPDADLRINPVDMEKGLKDELRTLDDQIGRFVCIFCYLFVVLKFFSLYHLLYIFPFTI